MSLTNETLKMSKISGLDYANATDYMTTAIRGFKMELSEANTVVDVYSALAASTAVSTQELAEAMTRTASSMESVGSSFQETSAMMATVIAVTRESANNIGSAFKSIASRYGEMKSDPSKLVDSEGEELAFNKVDAALKSVGITMKTTDGQFRSFTEVIMELADRWDTLTSVQQRYIATQFAGNRQQSRFLALVSNKDLLQANLQTAQSSEDAGTLQVLKTLDSLETKIEQVRVAYQQFYTTMGIENVWKTGLDALKSYINTLNSLPKLFGKIPIGAINAIMTIVNLLKTVAQKALQSFATAWTNALAKSQQQSDSTGKQNFKSGQDWAANWMRGVQEKIGDMRTVAQNAVKAANAAAANEANLQFGQQYTNKDQALNTLNNLSDERVFSTAQRWVEKYGVLLPSWDAATKTFKVNAQELREQMSQVIQEQPLFNAEMDKVPDTISKSAKSWATLSAATKQYKAELGSTLNTIGSAVSALSLLADTSTEAGQKQSGLASMAGGTMQVAGAAALAAAGQWPAAISTALSGITSIVNGFSLFNVTLEEKIKILENEAEELGNISKKSRAEVNQLDRAVATLRKLEEQRYKSAEAAEAYQEAVNDLANDFPQFITGYDEAGNAVANLSAAEEYLTLIRQQSIEDLAKLADKEVEVKEAQIRQAREQMGQSAAAAGAFVNQSNDFQSQNLRTLISLYQNSDAYNSQYSAYNTADQVNDIVKYMLDQIGITVDEAKRYFNLSEEENLSQYLIDNVQNIGTLFDELYQNLVINQRRISPPNAEAFIAQMSRDPVQALHPELFLNEETFDTLSDLEKSQNRYNKAMAYLEYLPATTDFSTDMQAHAQLIEAYESAMAYRTLLMSQDAELTESQSIELDTLNRQLDIQDGTLTTLISKTRGTSFAMQQLNAAMMANVGAQIKYQDIAQTGFAYQDNTESLLSHVEKQALVQWNNEKDLTDANGNKMYENFNDFVQQQASVWLGNANAFYTALGDHVKEFNVLASNPYTTQQQIDEYLDNLDIDKTFAADWFDTTLLDTAQKMLTDAGFTSLQATQFASTGRQEVLSKFIKFQDLYQKFVEQDAPTIEEQINGLFVYLDNLPIEAWSILNQYDLTSVQGIDDAAVALRAAGIDEDFINQLNNFKNYIVENYILTLQVINDGFSKTWEEDQKTFKTFTSGLSSAERQNIIKQAKNLGIEDFSKSDYWKTLADGQYAMTQEGLKVYEKAQLAEYKKRQADFDETQKIIDSGDALTIASKLGLSEEEAFEPGRLDTAVANFERERATYEENIDLVEKTIAARVEFAAGNYAEVGGDIAKLAAEADWKHQDNPIVQTAVDTYRSAIETLLTDLETLSLDQVEANKQLGKYDAIGAGRAFDISGGIRDITIRYISAIEQTLEGQNERIAKAIEAAEKKDRSLESAAADVQWIDDKLAYASMETATAIANALGVRVDEIVGEYDLSFGAYQLHLDSLDESKQKLIGKIDNIKQTTYDSVISYIEGITDVITSGMKGNLKGADIFNLAGQLDARKRDLGKQGNNLNYLWNNVQRTADGLKLSKEATIELYNQLKQIDAIQAQIVFKEMVDSAKETDENYQNQVTTLIRIKELEDQINDLSDNKNDARLKMYQAELEVAKEIQRTRLMTDDDSWNFLDNKLPSGFANPLSFADAIVNSYKAMNKGIKNKYMDPTEYYNILQQMQQMADQTNTTLHFLGHEIKAGSTDAAELINTGFEALKYVDGKGVMIDLKTVGIQVSAGSAAMAEGFDESIESIAQSQIDMLTALKNVMQGFAAMEELSQFDLDKNGNNQLELIDLFPAIDKQDFKVTQETQGYLNQLFDEFLPQNKELVNFLQGITIQDQSIYYWLEQAKKNNIQNEQEANAFLTSLQWMFELGQTTDWTEENITDIIQQISQKYGIGGQIELGEYGSWTMWGDHIIKIQGQNSYLDNNGDEHGTPEEAVLANVRAEIAAGIRSMNGDQVQLSEQDNTIALGGKNNFITFQLDQDKKTVQFYYNGNGPFNSLNEAMNAAIDQQMTTYDNESSWTAEQKSLQAQYDLGIKLVPTLDNPDLTNEGRNLLLQGAQAVADEWNKGDYKEFVLTYGFSLEGKEAEANQSLIDSIDRILQNEGLAATPVSIAVSVANEEEQKGLVELINAVDKISRQIEVTITPKDNSPENLGFSLNDILQAADEETKTFIMQVTGYDDTGAEASLDNLLIMQLIGQILDYNDGSADISELKARALHAIIQTYSDSGAPLKNLKIMAMTALLSRYDDRDANPPTQPEVDALIGAFVPKDDTVTPDHLVSMLIATIAAYRNGKMANPNALISTLTAIITSFKENAAAGKKPNDLVSALDAWITKFDGDTTSAEELINSLVAIIQQFSTGLTPEQIKEQLGLTGLGATVTVTPSGEIQITGNIDQVTAKIAELQSDPNYNQMTITAKINGITTSNRTTEQWQAISQIRSDLARVGQTGKVDIFTSPDDDRAAIQEYLTLLEEFINLGGQLESTDFTNLSALRQVSDSNISETATKLLELGTPGVFNTAATEGFLNSLLSLDQSNVVETLTSIAESLEQSITSIIEINTKWQAVQQTITDVQQLIFALQSIKLAPIELTYTKKENNSLMNDLQQPTTFGLPLNNNVTYTIESDGIDAFFGILIGALANLSAQTTTTGEDLGKVTTALDKISKSKGISSVGILADKMRTIPSGKGTLVSNLADAMSKIPDVSAKVQSLADILTKIGTEPIKLTLDITTNNPDANLSGDGVPIGETGAKGRRITIGGAAQAKGTLMGELGPELYVQGGRYYVAGQNGAEFVNLADDAIVFNHLQTKKLLSQGNTGRGKPVTSERNAVAYAAGTGPAMASASAMVAKIDNLISLWQGVLNSAQSKTLGQKAGLGGSGGGGGGGSALNVTTTSKELETWYNLLQQIERIEAKITYQEQLRSKLESDRVANGKAYYASQKASLQALTDETQRHAQLAQEYSNYRDKLINALTTDNFYKQFYTQDKATGAIQYNAGAIEKMKRLQDTNSRGQFLHSAQEQFEIVMRDYGLTTDSDLYKKMITNDDGTQQFIMEGGKYYKTKWDEKTGQYVKDKEMTAEELTTAMEAVMEKFWTEMDATRDEITEVQKQVDEQENAVFESEEQRNELLQEIEDNMIDVQQKVYDAVEHLRQEAIDELQEQRDILADSNQAFIDGLNEQLTQEREMYSKNESDAELTKLQRQLAILQRSGGSASAIRALQDQINSKQQDMYFDERQAQIDAIQKASDNELERLDRQIELMEESLTYDKENGLLWNEVAQILTGTPEQIAQYIHENSDDYRTKSATEQEKINREDNLSIQQYAAYRDDKNKPTLLNDSEHDWEWYSNYIANTDYAKVMSDKATQNAVRNAFEAKMKETGDENQAREAANAVLKDAYDKKFPKKATEPTKEPDFVPPPTTSGSSGSGSSGSGNTTPPPAPKKEYLNITYKVYCSTGLSEGKEVGGTCTGPSRLEVGTSAEIKCTVKDDFAYGGWKISDTSLCSRNGNTITALKAGSVTITRKFWDRRTKKKFRQDSKRNPVNPNKLENGIGYDNLQEYSSGGLADYTGLAMVHGSKRKPEAFIDADTTRIWKEKILNGNNSLTSLLANLQEHWSALPTTSQYESINSSTDNSAAVNIENATVEMHVDSIANDYDARRAGQSALEEIMKIARKSGTLATNRG